MLLHLSSALSSHRHHLPHPRQEHRLQRLLLVVISLVLTWRGELTSWWTPDGGWRVGVGQANGAPLCFLRSADQFPVSERHFHHGNTEMTITLEDSGRVSHQIANRILRILLSDVAGYKKVAIQYCPLYDKQNITAVLDRIAGRMASKHCQPPVPNQDGYPETNVHLEVWMEAEFNKGPWLEWKGGGGPLLAQYLIDSGSLGPQGRMGWYVPSYLVQDMWDSSQIVVDHWRALQITRLTRKLSWWGKSELSDLNPDYRVGAYLNRRCQENVKGRRRNCATLFTGYKGVDSGILRTQIESLELDVDIVWMEDKLEDFVMQQVDNRQPVLFFNWRPNSLVARGKFTRLSFPEDSLWHERIPPKTEFPVNQLTKVTWAALKTGAPEAFAIISNLSFTDQEYNRIVQQASQGDSVEKVACDWVQANQDKWMGWLPRSLTEKPKIFLGGLFPLSGKSWSQPGLVEGAKFAIDLVNGDANTLPNHTLELVIKDTQCQYDVATSHFISFVQDRERALAGILGPGCSDPAERVASLSKNFHMLMVSYGAEAEALSDRSKYPYFFRTVPPIQRYSQVYPELFKALGWGLVGALAEDGQELPDYHMTLQDKLQHHGISLIVKRKYLNNSSAINISQILQELKAQKVRVIIADVFSNLAREIMCEAYKQKMTGYEGYVWFLPSWYPEQWWDVEFYNSRPSHLERDLSKENVACSTAQVRSAIEGHFIVSKAFTAPPHTPVVGGITVKEYKETYALRCGMVHVEESNFASFVYDAVWVFAKGFHSLLQENQRALKTLQTKQTAQALRQAISQVDFIGVSGPIRFNKSDRNAELIILQFFSNESALPIGHYVPFQHAKGEQQGELKLDVSAIRWLSPMGAQIYPQREDEDNCPIEALRASLGSSCLVAFLVVTLIPVVIICVGIALFTLFRLRTHVKSEFRVINERMKELGLLTEEDRLILRVDDWEVPRKDIVLNRELGEGAFGTVMGGEMYKENDGWVSVAVKTLKPDFKVEEKLEFLTEVDMMKKLGHPNVVQLLGVCTRDVIYAIMEFMLHGNLKTFLLSRRHLVGQGVKEAEDTQPERLTQMAIDVAQGLDYLHINKFVHRDLACRNCLVHANRTVKIGDFGMTRHMSDTDIYRFARKGMLPVRWTAPESLKDGIYTAKSDIWSFGVLVFEIVTFGSFPYQGMSNKEVLDYVGRGLPLPLPDKCPRDLQTFIKWCMSYNSDFRPDLTALLTELHINSSYLSPCLDAPAFSVEHEDSDSLEIPVAIGAAASASNQLTHNSFSASSMLPFGSYHSRTRSHSMHDKPLSSTKKKNFTVPSFPSFTNKLTTRTSTSSKKSPTSSRSSSHCSGGVVLSNSMTCGIHTCGVGMGAGAGAGWISRPSSGIMNMNGTLDHFSFNARQTVADADMDVEVVDTDNMNNSTWRSSGSHFHSRNNHNTTADVHSEALFFPEDSLVCAGGGEEEESGVSSLLLGERGEGGGGGGLKMNASCGGSCSDRLEQLASSFPLNHQVGDGSGGGGGVCGSSSHRSLNSLRSQGHHSSGGGGGCSPSPLMTMTSCGGRGVAGSSGYLSQNSSRLEAKHICQTVTSL